MTLCTICNKSIQTEHDMKDLMMCLRMACASIESIKSHTQNLAKNTGYLE